VDNNAAFVVRNLRMMVRDSDLPCPQASASLQAIGKAMSRTVRTPQLALAWILLPDFTGLPTKAAEDRARAAAMLSAASALDWRVRNGSFPAALSEAMPRVPQDPFDLKPIRYRREGNGFVVWSVGKTGHFGGGRRGVKAPSDEVAFRYPPPPRP
jgi:hypothetical protein